MLYGPHAATGKTRTSNAEAPSGNGVCCQANSSISIPHTSQMRSPFIAEPPSGQASKPCNSACC
ncbi:Uncharacterised protein [Mycobacteroides abscessus]|uniref:Uncharacterized protein n=1 Tax=Mycobacteroides abscessus subsp. massiliense TaxID=1962118 RepID=A0AB38DEP1_9MYCO|nr:hypothetical protein [Mycobacteroides abscessus]SHX13707.1 Uncharacterised protein [Mycobacteroides abscessus subsp. abscessus]SKD21314.1 Uncharacterised protein [Mycobacteroides abscessus subsp. massiliense]QOF33869.1 hypothetical protein E3G57_002781 [Mycobacteroides abscessus]CPR35908.1 Uncharacterised protein [Mycobacteroides abscessus]